MDDLSTNPIQGAASLIGSARWFALATVAPNGEPAVSYLPFACVDGALGIVVSGLASHAANLIARPAVSLLAVGEPEPDPDAFARARLSIEAIAREAVPNSRDAGAVWDALAARHGDTVAVLRGLPDFRAIVLQPVRARLVLGFAAAYDLDAATLETLVRSVEQSRP
jgi:putative heme iron utilization protein